VDAVKPDGIDDDAKACVADASLDGAASRAALVACGWIAGAASAWMVGEESAAGVSIVPECWS
jgi:hypothetical protein